MKKNILPKFSLIRTHISPEWENGLHSVLLPFYAFLLLAHKNRPPDLEVHFYLSGQSASSMFAGLISNLKFSIFKAAFTLLQQIRRSIRTACGPPWKSEGIPSLPVLWLSSVYLHRAQTAGCLRGLLLSSA